MLVRVDTYESIRIFIPVTWRPRSKAGPQGFPTHPPGLCGLAFERGPQPGAPLNQPIMIIVVIASAARREPPSSTFPAAPAIETSGEAVPETVRPLAKVVPLPLPLRKAAGQ